MNETTEALLIAIAIISSIWGVAAYACVLVATRRSAGGGAGSGGTGTGPVLPPVPVAPRFTGIKSTDWAGDNDSRSSKTSAYDGHVIDGESELAAALPFHFDAPLPTIRVFANGKSVDAPVEDVGPWFDGRQGWAVDPYWQTNSRPRAETDSRTNGSGIDLTPAVYKALGFTGDLDNISSKVDWDFASVLDATPTATDPPPGSAPWITLGRTYNGLVWGSGPMPMQIVAWLDAIVAKFPEEAAYCNALKVAGRTDWFAWCGVYVRSMLAPFGIKGPISAAGLRGETTTADWAYVDAWLTWGTKVWGPEDGSINNAQPQVGDVLVWNAPGIHHVSFYGKLLPDTDTFDSLGGDQGKPLRVCEEELPMSWCVGIRRAPASG